MRHQPLAAMLVVAGFAYPAVGQCPIAWRPGDYLPGVREEVTAMAVYDDGTGAALYVAGALFAAGEHVADGMMKWDGASWSPVAGLYGHGGIRALTVFNGELIAAGNFRPLASPYYVAVARWNGVEWLPFGDQFVDAGTRSVRALAVHNNRLYAGGGFTTLEGVAASNIAQWDGVEWSPLGAGIDRAVVSLGSYDGKLFAGGSFTRAGGNDAFGIAQWDGSAWSPVGGGLGSTGAYGLTNFEGDLIAVGSFSRDIGDISLQFIARWNGVAWSPMNANLCGFVRAAKVINGTLYAGGDFQQSCDGTFRYDGISAWNGSEWIPLGIGQQPTYLTAVSIAALAEFEGAAIIGGILGFAGGVATSNIARWDGEAWSAVGARSTRGFDLAVHALAARPNRLVAAGIFQHVGDTPAHWIAERTATGWQALGEGINGTEVGDSVFATTFFGTDVIAGGSFSTAGGNAANNIARWDGMQWSALGSGTTGPIAALSVYDGKLYAGGDFTHAGGQPTALSLASWDGATWSPEGVGGFGEVRTLALYDGRLAIAGDVQVSGARVGLWDGSTWTPLGGSIFGRINSIANYENALVIGGQFTNVGVPATGVARWNGSAWEAMSLGMPSASVSELVVVGSTLYASAQNSIRRWDGTAWQLVDTVGGDCCASVSTLMADGAQLVVGGSFQTAGSLVSRGIAWYGPTCVAGDVNCDDSIDFFDIDPFVQALFDPVGYAQAFPACDLLQADTNADGAVSFFDIDPFLDELF